MEAAFNRAESRVWDFRRARTSCCRTEIYTHVVALAIFCTMAFAMPGCGGGGNSSSGGPSVVVVVVQPASASLFLGQTQPFQASVTGTTNMSVTWSVNGVPGGSASSGMISPSGLYTAPGNLPSPASITVTAVSESDPQASGSSTVTVKDDIVVNVSPNPATVPTGGAQVFTASVSGTGNPATSVTWSVSGIAGGNSTVGTIASSGGNTSLYTAPAIPPSPAVVNVTATSVADTSKTGSASVTITCAATNTIAPSTASVALVQMQTFTASFCLAPGVTITWDVNGIVGGNAVLGTIVNSSASTALYTAPADLPTTNPVTIDAVAGLVAASATVTITSNVTVSVAPLSATIPINQRKIFTSTVTNTSDPTVVWSVNGIANGNATVGQVCVSGTNPCMAPSGPISGAVDYVAPGSVPQINPVTLTATSLADGSKSGSAMVIVTGASGSVAVTVSPIYAFAPSSSATLSKYQFFAAVSGSSNESVTWGVQSAVAGQGCGGAACGSVDANGLYAAPTAAPSPNAVSVIATSLADPTKSGAATIAITSGPAIEEILPSSVLAGAVEGFPLILEGVNFVAGSGSAASTILINGAPRGTTCATATRCTTALNPVDVQSAATLTIQVQNPGSPGALSNPVAFVIVPFDVSEDVIPLSATQSAANGITLIVTEPTTAAASSPVNVDFIGFLTGGNNCGVQGSPLTVTRPSSGSATVSLCVHGNGLDPSFTYAFAGPSGGDIGVTASTISGLFSNTIELDLQISSTTLPGVRTLFITTLNNDRGAATGMLEVK